MRNRNTAIATKPIELFQFFTDSITGAATPLDFGPQVLIYNSDPRRNQSLTPIQEILPTAIGIGGYRAEVTVPTAGWYWDRWVITINSEVFIHESTFYAATNAPVAYSNFPLQSKEFAVYLKTPRVLVNEIRYLVFEVDPKTTPGIELRLMSGTEPLIDWSGDITLDGAGNMLWLVDFTNFIEGIHSIEARCSSGVESLLAQRMLLKVEQQEN